jgi:penicillin-binding protein 1B
MSKGRKKAAARRKKPRAAARKPRRSLIWRASLLAAGVCLGLLLPWIIYLDEQVRREFEGRKWDLPSRVYARPLELFPGARISPEDLEVELSAAGYRRAAAADRPGQYVISRGTVEVHRRPFRFPDGEEGAGRFLISLDGGAVSGIREAPGGTRRDLLRLEPAEIASIYPLHREDRTLLRIGDVPTLLVTGLQAVEDRNFKHHPGVDPRGIARAVLANLKAGRAVQGGSTLTQQLVKNYFLDDERSLSRKFNEAIMAVLLELRYDKAAILEAYINEVFLGQRGAYAVHGFGEASQFYFDRPLDQLEPHHIALLIGLVKGPSHYNPRRHPERARARRDQVLAAFEETGLLGAAQAAAAADRELDVIRSPRPRGTRYHAFIGLVRRQLAQVYRDEDLRAEGLRIFSTLSPSEQEKAQQAVTEGLGRLRESGFSPTLQAAMVLAETGSGEVRALVGDRYSGRAGFNRALDARRQVGSVIKPLVYLLALEHDDDYHLLSPISDEPIQLKQPGGSVWSPSNYDGESHGEVSLLEALTRSYNQATVRLGLTIGVSNLVSRMRQLGVRSEMAALPSAFLGAVELTPMEVTQIYQSIAAGGFSVPLRAVTAVQTPGGQELVRYPLRMLPQPRRDAVAVLNYALTRVVDAGTARDLPGLLGIDVPIAGKTGTTNDRRDSWFVGYTRNRIATVWVGEDDNRPAGVTGSNAAMRLWAGLFRQISLEPVDLRMPEGAHWLWVDPERAERSGEGCPGAEQMPFVEGSGPIGMTPCLADSASGRDDSFWRKWFGRKD